MVTIEETQTMTQKYLWIPVLTALIFLAACGQAEPTPLPASPTSATAATATSPLPTNTPTPTSPPPSPFPTPTLTTESKWQCDPSGGLTCFVNLTRVAMFNAQEGWAVGGGGVILHYSTHPGASTPTWQWVTPEGANFDQFYGLSLVGPNEWWAVTSGASPHIVHYHNGKIEDIPVPIKVQFLDIVMFDNDEGWVVGDLGVILHYTQGQWQQIASPTREFPLFAIDMLNREEGWALSRLSEVILHYTNGQWDKVEVPDGYYWRT